MTVIITMRDWRKVGGCPDALLWCSERGIDWRKFVREGLDIEILRESGDNLSKMDDLEAAAINRRITEFKNG